MLIQISSSPADPEARPESGATASLLESAPDRDAGAVLAAHSASPLEPVTVRPARITDMPAVEALIRVYAMQNLMLPRSPEQLARNFREFVVAVDENDRLVGCGALRIFTDELAEVASLAVERAAQGRGIGRLVVERLLREASGLGLRTVFALTLEPRFFTRLGFRVVPKADFPLKVWADCRSCPKLHACDEIAVALELSRAEP